MPAVSTHPRRIAQGANTTLPAAHPDTDVRPVTGDPAVHAFRPGAPGS